MFELIKDSLNSWNKTKSERQKLQHVYIVLAGMVTVIAGLVSLINTDAGHTILLIAGIALLTFGVNALVWNLLQSSLLDKLSSKQKRK